MSLNLKQLKMKAYRWFQEKEPLITKAKNRPELEKRVRWLSEGSLYHHLNKFQSGEVPCPREQALFREFVASNPPLLARVPSCRYNPPRKRKTMSKRHPEPMPPDVAAYLINAATEMAADYGFTPSSEAEMARWLEVHHQDICRRASASMWLLFNELMQRKEMMDMAADHLGKQVYETINANRDPSQPASINPRFTEYCKAMGYAGIDEWKKKEKGSGAGFICWCHANPNTPS